MAIRVEGPDGEIVEFPEGTDRSTMERAMRERYSDLDEATKKAKRNDMGVVGEGESERLQTFDEFSGRARTHQGAAREERQRREARESREEDGGLSDEWRQTIRQMGGTAGGMAGGVLGPGAASAWGSRIGGTAGAAGGPVGMAVGTVAGGMIGAGLGYAASAFATQDDEEESAPIARASTEYAKQDGMWSVGLMSAGPLFARHVIGPLAGLGSVFGKSNKEADEVIRLAERFEPIEETKFDAFTRRLGGGEGPDNTGKFNIPSYVAAQSKVARGFPNVLGVFPYAGSPLRRELTETGKRTVQEVQETLNINAPNASLYSMGVDIERSAKEATRAFNEVAAAKYKKAEDYVNGIGNPEIIPVDGLKVSANRYLEGTSSLRVREQQPTGTVREQTQQGGRIITDTTRVTETPRGRRQETRGRRVRDSDDPSTGRTAAAGVPPERGNITRDAQVRETTRPFRSVHNTDVKRFFEEVRDMEGPISYQGWRDLVGEVRGLLRKDGVNGADADALKSFKTMLEDTVMASVDPKFNELYAEADKFYAKYMSKGSGIFRSPALTPFKQTDDLLFTRKRADRQRVRTMEPDQLADRILGNVNPSNIRNIRAALGDEGMEPVRQAYFTRAFQNSFSKQSVADPTTGVVDEAAAQTFNFDTFAENIGVTSREGMEVFEEMMKGSKVNRERLEDLIGVGTRLGEIKLTESNTFVKRRLVLGGIGALTGFFTGGIPGVALGAAGLLAANRMTRVLASPRMMKNFKKAANVGGDWDFQQRRQALASFFNGFTFEDYQSTFDLGDMTEEEFNRAMEENRGRNGRQRAAGEN